ncbi:MAG TPA: MBL fold metallo-hydrolase [Acholeplasmataceae bacterium]|nr:MBL fold metallo-hydrolase [Acholeplasmataceae bacterium]
MSRENNLKVTRFTSSLIACNLYLLENSEGEVIIDPAVEYERVFEKREERLKGIILTHCHFDHLLALETYLKKSDCPVYLHEAGLEKLNDPEKNASSLINQDWRFPIPKERMVIIESDTTHHLLGKTFRFLETPGHASCALCIIVDDYLFTGDTLFKGAVGRTDLVSSDSKAMRKSLDKLYALADDYSVYPGHGDKTNLNYEKNTNPFLKWSLRNV